MSGGQFFQWRFLTRDLWWHAHPYSLSALPRPPLRPSYRQGLSATTAAPSPGSSPAPACAIEGPYGAFTHHARSTDRVALIGAGVGITPLRALLEDLPRHVDVIVVVRASATDEPCTATRSPLLSSGRGGRVYAVIGPRHKVRFDARFFAASCRISPPATSMSVDRAASRKRRVGGSSAWGYRRTVSTRKPSLSRP